MLGVMFPPSKWTAESRGDPGLPFSSTSFHISLSLCLCMSFQDGSNSWKKSSLGCHRYSFHFFISNIGPRLTRIDTAASCQAFLLLGYDQGVMSGLVGADNEFGKQFGHPDANMQGIRE